MTNARVGKTRDLYTVKGGFEQKKKKSAFRTTVLPLLILLAAVLAIAGTAVLVSVLQKEIRLGEEQASFVENLQLTAGSYDANTIVLPKTNQYEAQKLADRFHARLRLSPNGAFAVLYLPEDVTILDICSDPENRDIIANISPDYLASVEEVVETDTEEINYDEVLHLPKAPDYEVNDDYYFMQDYLSYLNFGTTWQSWKGDGVTVAVIDTGIDTDHPEFQGKISNRSYNATYDKVVEDWDNDWSLIEDEQGHGTAVAGVIAAAMDEQGIVGVAPEVNLIIIKAECTSDGEFLHASDLVFGLYYAIECDADVVNMSFTARVDFSDAVILADDSDILCVAATGNDRSPSVGAPACYDEVVAVGALDANSWTLAQYSNYTKKMVVAPGTVFTTMMGGGYGMMSGTSFSAPIVSAALALLKQWQGPYAPASDLRERLYISCYDLGIPGPDPQYGYGALDVSYLFGYPGKVTYNMMTDELDDIEGRYARGRAIQIIPEPERLYAVFDGWYYDPDYTEEMNWYEDRIDSESITLYAKWGNEDDVIPFEYRILEDGTVEILKYIGRRKYITIPNYIEKRQVSSIGDYAFAGEYGLRRILLPQYLKRIGNGAFKECSSIVTFSLPDGVITIGDEAFAGDSYLTSITLGSSLKTVGDFAFQDCGLLTSIYFPSTLESINGSAFYRTGSMLQILTDSRNEHYISIDGVLYNRSKTTIVAYPAGLTGAYVLPEETKTIGVFAFACTSSYQVDFSHVEVIEDYAFDSAAIRLAYIPDSCIEMGQGAFAGCGNMTDLRIGHSLTSISKSAFEEDSNLETIFIPKNIRFICDAAFATMGAGTRQILFEEGSQLVTIGYKGFCGKDRVTELRLPPSLVSIGDEAFSNYLNLRVLEFGEDSDLQTIGTMAFSNSLKLNTVSFPNTVRSIGGYCFLNSGIRGAVTLPASLEGYGPGIFASCHSLTDIYVAEGNLLYESIDGVAYSRDGKMLMEYPAGNPRQYYSPEAGFETIYDAAFYGSWELEHVSLPSSYLNINESAFQDCRWMKNYDLSDHLEYIGPSAFSYNVILGSINLPSSTRQISRLAFAYDRLLRTIYIPDDTRMTRIGFRAFALCGITSIRIPSAISSIAQYAFEDCDWLTRVEFAENSRLRAITGYLFKGCDSIQEIEFGSGSSLTQVQAHGFDGMPNLYSVSFGNAAIQEFDNYAFARCLNLEKLEISGSLKNIGRFAFYKCRYLRDLVVPETLEHIGEYAFYATEDLNLYFQSELLPIYLDENWDVGLKGYYTGVTTIVEAGDWTYSELKNGTLAIVEYRGDDTSIDLTAFPYGNVSVIGGYAFAYKNIETLVLPDSLEQIQRYAFAGNTKLQDLIIPKNVTYIAQYAFENTGIRTLTFAGNRLKVLEQYAFAHTRSLRAVTIPGSLEKLGSYAFQQSGIEELTFGAGFSLTEIPEGAFAETRLHEVVIPDCVNVLSHNAFSHNQNLERVDLGSGELILMSYVFYNTGLREVHLGANVRTIGEYSFVGLPNLEAFEVDAENPNYSVKDGVLYNKAGTKIITVPAGKTGSFTISKDVEIIGFGAFEASALSEVRFEADSSLTTLGYRAFYGMKKLKSIEVPANVVSIDYYAFAECDALETVTFAEGNRLSGIYEGAFFGCRSLKNIQIPDTVVEISGYAFYACESLPALPIGQYTQLLGIYEYAFAYSGITELELPEGLYDVGAYAFRGIGIREFTYDPEDPRVIIFGKGVFADCNLMESITLPFTGSNLFQTYSPCFGYIFGSDYYEYDKEFVPESLKNITITLQTVYNVNEKTRNFGTLPYVETVRLPDETVLIGVETFSDWTSLRGFSFPAELVQIGNYAFYGCESLESVVLHDCMQSIGTDAFNLCTGLSNLDLGNSLLIIEDGYYGTFMNCPFETAKLPDSLQYLGHRAFRCCSNLKQITIPAGTTIGTAVFEDCLSLEYAELNCAEIPSELFLNCQRLKDVILSEAITSVGNRAFSSCSALKHLDFASSVRRVGEYAFSGTAALNQDLLFSGMLEEIGENAFDGSGITGVQIPGTIRFLSQAAFQNCGLEWAEIGDGIRSIPYNCFFDCGDLRTVILPDSVEVIERDAFGWCGSLVLYRLPASLTTIGTGAFARDGSIKSIRLPERLTYIGDGAFDECEIWYIQNESAFALEFGNYGNGAVASKAEIIKDGSGYRFLYPEYFEENDFIYRRELNIPEDPLNMIGYCGEEEEITIPYLGKDGNPLHFDYGLMIPNTTSVVLSEGIETVFLSGSGIQSLSLPASFDGWGMDRAIIDGCTNLKTVRVHPDNPHIREENGLLFYDDELSATVPALRGQVVIPEGTRRIRPGAFMWRKTVTGVTFPDGLEEIGYSAFDHCYGLTSISFPDSLKRIETEAFYGCLGLRELDLGKVEYVGEEAFHGIIVTDLTLPATLTEIGNGAFEYLPELEHLTIEGGVPSLPNDAFSQMWIETDDAMTELTVPGSVKTLGYQAFAYREHLTSVTLEEGIESIGEKAFYQCIGLETLHIPASVKEIGKSAFNGIQSLSLDPGNTSFVLSDGILFTADGKNIVYISQENTDIVYPDGWEEVNDFTFNTELKSIVIPEGVERIGRETFRGCTSLETVILPSTLKEIGDYAFYECANLKEIVFPEGLERIGGQAFSRTGLTSVHFPASVHNLSTNQFDGCLDLASVTVGEGSEYSICDGILYSADEIVLVPMQLTGKATVREGITNIGYGVFQGSHLSEIVLPDTVEHISAAAFRSSTISQIRLSDSLRVIESFAFEGCNGLTRIDLPESLEIIYPYAFYGCDSFTDIYIPASVTEMYKESFGGYCIETFTVNENNSVYASVDNVVYNKAKTEILFAAPQAKGSVTICEGVEIVPSYLLGEGVTEIILPESVRIIGSNAFCGASISTVRLPAGLEIILENAFEDCRNLAYVENDSPIHLEIGDRANGRVAEYAKILIQGDSVTELVVNGWHYQRSGDYLYSRYILDDPYQDYTTGKLIAYLGDAAEIVLPTELDGITVEPEYFQSNRAEHVIIADGVKEIPWFAFSENKRMKKITISDSVKGIGAYAFYWCLGLEEVKMPSRLQEIAPFTFCDCWSLKEIVIPEGVSSIGADAFWRDSELETVVLPSSLQFIEDEAFEYCSKLQSIELPEHLERIGNRAFQGIRSLTSVEIPRFVKAIGYNAFGWCEQLERILLPDTGLYIGPDAFAATAYANNEDNWEGDFLYCGTHLLRYRGNETFVRVEKNTTSICENAFEGNYNTRYLELAGNAWGALQPKYLSSLEMVTIRVEPEHRVNAYFATTWNEEGYYELSVPNDFKQVVLGTKCVIEHRDEFSHLTGIGIFVEGTKTDSPYDRLAPGWNNGNMVTYGDRWYRAEFYDGNRELITIECFRNSQVIRPPYVVLPTSGETGYKHVGWDLDGDGKPDGMPASRISDVQAYAVVETYSPAIYTVLFFDLDRRTVLYEYQIPYGETVKLPDQPEKKGYLFDGWENYTDGLTVETNLRFYSQWTHLGDGHDYVAKTVPPTCTEKGYTLHKCSICDEEYRTDYVDEKGHVFGDWIVDKEPTCSESGEEHRVCTVCEFTEEMILDTTGHTYVSTVEKEATCTEFGVMRLECSVCHHVTAETIPLRPHDFLKTEATKEYIEWLDHEMSGIVWGCNEEKTEFWYYTCSHCGRIRILAEEPQATVAGSGGHTHVNDALLDDDGNPVAVKCALCGEVHCFKHLFDLINHENNVSYYKCRNCGLEYEESDAPVNHTVRFVDWDGTVLSEQTVAEGRTPVPPADPKRASDETYTYAFAGWTPELAPVSGDATYTAAYTQTFIEYTVKFVDWDGKVISEQTYHYGDTVVAPENPTRPSDGANSYTFSGWDKDITLCYGDATYKATYTTDVNVFTVTFKNEDGSVISVKTYHYGDTVVQPENPEKQADSTYSYIFKEWTPAVVPVTGDATYTAVYDRVYIDYTVTFKNEDGTVISEAKYHYGDTVTVPADPTKAADEQYTYSFESWVPNISSVTGNATYTAVYKATPKTEQTVEVSLDTANGGQNGETTILIPSDGKTTLSKISSTTAAPDYILGDINGDGDIDGRDYIVVKKYVLGTADLTDRQLQIADINGDGEVDGIDYLLIKKHVLGTYTVPEPQPLEVDGPDYADFAVIVVDANGKVQTVKPADGKSKSDLTVPTGGYAIAIPKAVLDANEALKNAINNLKANDTVTLNGVSLNEQGVAVLLKNASILIQP